MQRARVVGCAQMKLLTVAQTDYSVLLLHSN
jgi:hypothetical protein